nr:immunoglobulin light chain junction region [Macaca mulatta]
CMQTFEFPFTF